MQPSSTHQVLEPLKWLIGTWKSIEARGLSPKPFSYCEQLIFSSVGQPILNYSSTTWHPETLSPMHLESGFLRIKPETNTVSFMVAHNFGLTSIEEGFVNGNCLHLKSAKIARMSFAKEPELTEIVRGYKLTEEGKLEFEESIATTKYPLTEHLKVIYEKV